MGFETCTTSAGAKVLFSISSSDSVPTTNTAILAATTWKTPLTILFSRDLHILSLPKTVDPLGVHVPMTLHEQPMNTPCSKAWTLPGQSTHLTKQPWFIIRPTRLVSLGATRLVEHTACSTFRHFLWPQTATYLGDGSPSTFGAYQFPFAASFRIWLSSACSATNFFNGEFSFSRDFNCFAISGCMPPYF